MENKKQIDIDKLIKGAVLWVGTICAVIAAIAYLVVVIIMVTGFKSQTDFARNLIFASVNAGVGLLIGYFLKLQGVAFAKNVPANAKILEKYHSRKTKERKYRSINSFWVKSTIIDFLTKGATLAISTVGIVHIFIEASDDPMLIALAVFNIIMFLGFGLVSMSKAYSFFNEEHMEWVKNKLDNIPEDVVQLDIGEVNKNEHS